MIDHASGIQFSYCSKSTINWKNNGGVKICWQKAIVNYFEVVVFLLIDHASGIQFPYCSKSTINWKNNGGVKICRHKAIVNFFWRCRVSLDRPCFWNPVIAPNQPAIGKIIVASKFAETKPLSIILALSCFPYQVFLLVQVSCQCYYWFWSCDNFCL